MGRNIKNEEIFGDRYNVFRDDRDKLLSNKKSGGGVLLAVSVDYESEQISSCKCKEFDHVWVKHLIGDQVHIFVTVYFPQKYAKKDSFEILFSLAGNIISKFEAEANVHIYGDFNQRAANFIVDDENESFLIPIVGDNETLHSLFDRSAEIGLHQVNHVKNDVKNYRDVAILSSIPKLFESIINGNIFSQVKTLITGKLHGFVKGRSTATNLIHFVSFSLNLMDNGNYVEALYTDFSKVFDRVDIP